MPFCPFSFLPTTCWAWASVALAYFWRFLETPAQPLVMASVRILCMTWGGARADTFSFMFCRALAECLRSAGCIGGMQTEEDLPPDGKGPAVR